MTLERPSISRWVIHVVAWAALIAFSFLSVAKSKSNFISALSHIWVPLLEAAIIFYTNYLFLIDRFILRKRQYALFLIINILIILLFRFDGQLYQLLSGHGMKHIKDINKPHRNGRDHSEPLSLVRSLFGLVIPTVFALLIKVSERREKFELEKKKIENMHLQSELLSLKYQLQPHFFFNALNNIYALVEVAPEKAQQAIHSLSRLMQYLLYDTNREKVDLALELGFLEKYIDLMALRYTDDVVTTYSFPGIEEGRYTIAPLLLIPVIENAYKHGISSTEMSIIVFDITISGGWLFFCASNTNHPKTAADFSGSGIGLENLRKRLELIYPETHLLNTEVRNNMFNLKLSITLS